MEPQDVVINVGCELVLFCSDGIQRPQEAEFEWRFNGDALPASPNILERPTGELVIVGVTTDHTGNYSCRVWGLAGSSENVTMVTVVDPLLSGNVSAGRPRLSTPTPLLQTPLPGQTAQFVCIVGGFPEPSVVWLRDDQPVPNYDRLVVGMFEGASSLTLAQLRLTDTHTYSCVASNALGSESINFTLTIIGGRVILILGSRVWGCDAGF